MATAKKTTDAKSKFVPTFREYNSMSKGEQDAFKQGCKTVENKVKDRLGFIRPKDAA